MVDVLETTPEEIGLVEEHLSCNTATGELTQITVKNNSNVKAQNVERTQETPFVNTKFDDSIQSTAAQRANPMTPLRNIKSKGKAKEAEPVAGKIDLDDAKTEGWNNGYVTIREANGSFVSYAHGKEVSCQLTLDPKIFKQSERS